MGWTNKPRDQIILLPLPRVQPTPPKQNNLNPLHSFKFQNQNFQNNIYKDVKKKLKNKILKEKKKVTDFKNVKEKEKQIHNSHKFSSRKGGDWRTPEKKLKMLSFHSKSIFVNKTHFQEPQKFSNNNVAYSTTNCRFTALNCMGDETLSTSSAYSVLGVPPNCSLTHLKAAFRTKVSTPFFTQPPSVTLRVYLCVCVNY